VQRFAKWRFDTWIPTLLMPRCKRNVPNLDAMINGFLYSVDEKIDVYDAWKDYVVKKEKVRHKWLQLDTLVLILLVSSDDYPSNGDILFTIPQISDDSHKGTNHLRYRPIGPLANAGSPDELANQWIVRVFG
jgi:hypothetical protein